MSLPFMILLLGEFSYIYGKFSNIFGILVMFTYFQKVQLQHFNHLFCFHTLFVLDFPQYILFPASFNATF